MREITPYRASKSARLLENLLDENSQDDENIWNEPPDRYEERGEEGRRGEEEKGGERGEER